jgi:hypothetical protein
MSPSPSPEIQRFYGKVLDRAAKLGFWLLLATFASYVMGLLTPYVPLESVPRYWQVSLAQYLELTRIEPGWAWLAVLGYGDFLNFLPIALLAGVTLLVYLLLVFKFFHHREPLMAMIALLTLIVLGLAVSGIFKVGGH